MMRRILTFLVVEALFSAFFVSDAIAYSIGTHAFLTKETIKFYNQNFSKNPVKDYLVNFVIDGARREDDAPRWVNHFYDPVNNRGLNDGVYNGLKSKDWAQDEKSQTKLVYRLSPFSVASILSAKETEKIESIFDKSNFTWQKALDLYAQGQTERAFYTLGHVIHLIQDASVPDHTRNDAHPPFDDGGSPYENWTKKFNQENPDKDLTGRLNNKKPVLLADLNVYFDEMAKYSNNNFYSKDSIDNYDKPRAIEFVDNKKLPSNYVYGVIKSNDDNYFLVLGKKKSDFVWYTESNSQGLDDAQLDDIIINDYWSRLSTKSVQYNAGIINLFFQEAEKTKAKYELEKSRKPFLSTLLSGFGSLFGNSNEEPIDEFGAADGFSFVTQLRSDGSVPKLESAVKENEKAEIKTEPEAKEAETSIETEIVALNLQSVSPVNNPPAPTPQTISDSSSSPPPALTCGFNTNKFPTFQNLIINEVAWMGSANSPNDEWIELKNISGAPLDVSGWQIIDKGEQIKTTLEGKISSGNFYLLERSSDNSSPNVPADQIYAGPLGNSDEGLKLFNKNCDVIDQVMADPNWPAGDNAQKRSMERGADFSWHTYNGSGENGVLGTPKKENSQAAAQGSGNGGGGSGGGGNESPPPADNPTVQSDTSPSVNDASPAAPDELIILGGSDHILISEVLYNAEGNDAGKEFIELYNPTNSDKNLDDWSLESLSAGGSKTSLAKFGSKSDDSFIIKSHGFLLIGLNNYNGAPPEDIKRSGSLNNAGAAISLFDTEGNAIDAVSYDGSLPEGQSFERKAYQNGCVSAQGGGEYLGNGCDTDIVNDWEARVAPSPQNSQNLPEPRSAPQTIKNFNAAFSSGNLELNFNWDASFGFDGSATTYRLSEIIGTSTIFWEATASTSFAKKIKEIGRNYKFEIQAFDKDGLGSQAAEATVNAYSFLDSLFFYPAQNSTTTKYFLDLVWNQNPLIPFKLKHLASGQEPINNWQVLVFYKNTAAPAVQDIFWLDYTGNAPYKNWGLIAPGGFVVGYPNCLGGDYKTKGSALILPDGQNSCSPIAGNHASFSFNWPLLEDNRVSLEVSGENFLDSPPIENQDYISAAFYSFQPGYEPNNSTVSLVALDKTKYYFQDNTPDSKPPTAPPNLNFEYDQNQSLLKISWDKSTDPDSPDDSINYRLEYTDKAIAASDNFINIAVEPGAGYDFKLAAFDEKDNFSEPIFAAYEVPDTPPPFGITGIEWGEAEGATSTVLKLNFDRYPLSDSGKPLAVLFFFNQEPPLGYSFLDGDYRDGLSVGGNNSVLGFEYYPCDFGGSWLAKRSVGGLIFNNADCPEGTGALFMSRLLPAKINSGATEFSAQVLGEFKNGALTREEFDADDYVTLGFYELGPRNNQGRAYFQNISDYNKKIYFTRL